VRSIWCAWHPVCWAARAAAAGPGGKGGGGRPDMAQAGGPDGARASEALAALKAHLAGVPG